MQLEHVSAGPSEVVSVPYVGILHFQKKKKKRLSLVSNLVAVAVDHAGPLSVLCAISETERTAEPITKVLHMKPASHWCVFLIMV